MTSIARPALTRRILSVVDGDQSRVPVLLGGCGTGRTSLLRELQHRLGEDRCQSIDVERAASTPEQFHRAVCLQSPFVAPDVNLTASSPREAFEATLAFLSGARTSEGGTATFLLDEVLEFRTFESFPGLRHVMRDTLAAIAASSNRFVLTTRYVARALRWLREAGARLEVIQVPPLDVIEIRDAVASHELADEESDFIARAIHGLTDGHPGHAQVLIDIVTQAQRHGEADCTSALAQALQPHAALSAGLAWTYELRLHRARGYGALKGILAILSEDEPLTLTEIAHRLQRTPGSTKDYLSWLEDVDLLAVHRKRYTFADPLLRLWVRLHCQPTPPLEDDVIREVQQYSLARLPQHTEPVMALVAAHTPHEDERKTWGIIEID
jgi:hypothetical protein